MEIVVRIGGAERPLDSLTENERRALFTRVVEHFPDEIEAMCQDFHDEVRREDAGGPE